MEFMDPTGERMIKEAYRSSPERYLIYLFHISAYRFAEKFVCGKRVLDYGCGTGYGVAEIAMTARHVVAVDVSEDAIRYARQRFERDNIEFRVVSGVESLPFRDASFDTVLSFQVIEHVYDAKRYLSEIRRVLAPGGNLVLVTPDRSTRLFPGQRPWNRWHVREYSRRGLMRLMSCYFDEISALGMGGRKEVIGIEMRRCNRMRWLSLPVTLPFIPDRVRVAALNLAHRVRGPDRESGLEHEHAFDLEQIVIQPNISPSVNLVFVAS